MQPVSEIILLCLSLHHSPSASGCSLKIEKWPDTLCWHDNMAKTKTWTADISSCYHGYVWLVSGIRTFLADSFFLSFHSYLGHFSCDQTAVPLKMCTQIKKQSEGQWCAARRGTFNCGCLEGLSNAELPRCQFKLVPESAFASAQWPPHALHPLKCRHCASSE